MRHGGQASVEIVTTGNVLCSGGNYFNNGTILDDFFEYDPAADTFTVRPVTMPRARTNHTLVLGSDGFVHVIGGIRGNGLSEVIFRYIPACP